MLHAGFGRVGLAAEADLAPPTVTMYVPGKIDIAMSSAKDIVARLTQTYEADPHVSIIEVVDRWLVRVAITLAPISRTSEDQRGRARTSVKSSSPCLYDLITAARLAAGYT